MEQSSVDIDEYLLYIEDIYYVEVFNKFVYF